MPTVLVIRTLNFSIHTSLQVFYESTLPTINYVNKSYL
jgi:hypothetical protein